MLTLGGCQWAVIVAMVAVRVMEVTGNAVVDVIAVRNCLVAATGAVDMAGLMTAATVVRGAAVGVVAGDVDHMLVDMIFMRIVEVTVMQVIDVAAVTHGRVATTRPVLVRMVGMVRSGTGGHGISSFPCPRSIRDTAVRPSAAWSMALRTNGKTCSSASM